MAYRSADEGYLQLHKEYKILNIKYLDMYTIDSLDKRREIDSNCTFSHDLKLDSLFEVSFDTID
jgi:hypothetical protein